MLERNVQQSKVRGGADVKRSRGVHLGEGGTVCAAGIKSPAGSNPAPSPPYRSKLEAAYANKLEFEKRAGVIHDWWFEPLNLRLPGDKNFYKPDFLVRASDGLTFYEVKGRNKSDDRSLVKIKTAAGLTPWAHFIQVKRINGQWEEREFPCDSPMVSVIVEEEL